MEKVRPLMPDPRNRTAEVIEAGKVFHNNLPYSDIRIGDDLRLDGRPWTQPTGSGFLIHFGKAGYQNALSDRKTFIHELTNAWQGSHGFPMEYAADSAVQQLMSKNFTSTSTKAAAGCRPACL